ncbi:MAG: helix-turn-helix domain-containing protein, partial [Patescibacteria group bacterium]
MTQKLICMTEKELARYNIIQNLIDGKINGIDASKQIGISTRHIRRLKSRVIKSGAQGFAHRNRGKNSNRKLDNGILEKTKKCLKEKYYDFGPTFAAEKLNEIDKIKLSKETVRNIMINIDLWKSKPKKQPKNRHI